MIFHNDLVINGFKIGKTMSALIKFKVVEIDSRISFRGLKKIVLKYPVRSIALVPEPNRLAMRSDLRVPEIFW